MAAIERNVLWPLLADSASSLAPTERLLSRRNGRRMRRAQDREGSPAAVQGMETTLAVSIAYVHE